MFATTQTQVTLSSLSTADEMVRILSVGTPHTAKTPSRIFRWFSCQTPCVSEPLNRFSCSPDIP